MLTTPFIQITLHYYQEGKFDLMLWDSIFFRFIEIEEGWRAELSHEVKHK
jgi:hypothetical protein